MNLHFKIELEKLNFYYSISWSFNAKLVFRDIVFVFFFKFFYHIRKHFISLHLTALYDRASKHHSSMAKVVRTKNLIRKTKKY